MRLTLSISFTLLTLATLVLGCQEPRDPYAPMDQSKIISVRPAIPEGARKFVDQQNRIEQQRRKKMKKQADQPRGYTYMQASPPPKPTSTDPWTDIFNPAKWGKGNAAKQPAPHPAASQPG